MSEERTCIWCCCSAPQVTFKTKAHSIPKSLGGRHYCRNVCDSCNWYFGNKQRGKHSIDGVMKDSFIMTQVRLRSMDNEAGEVRPVQYKSEFFRVDFHKQQLSVSPGYRTDPHFQQKMGRLFRRGLFMTYLEELERQFGSAHDPKYNFIREFARYDRGDLPVFYFERRYGAILVIKGQAGDPELGLTADLRAGCLYDHPAFAEFDILQHTFGIPTSSLSRGVASDYFNKTSRHKSKLYRRIIQIENWNDMDLTLSRMDGEVLRPVSNHYLIPQLNNRA